jgi:hypothetical protein
MLSDGEKHANVPVARKQTFRKVDLGELKGWTKGLAEEMMGTVDYK